MSLTLDNPDALLLPRDVAALRRTTENALAQERWRGPGRVTSSSAAGLLPDR